MSLTAEGSMAEIFKCYIHIAALRMELGFIKVLIVINSLWPNDAIWQYRYGSTLAHTMAFCLTAPSHYLNQC